ncbi:MAG: hypothetical protein WA790_04240 [Sulfitobacter sp.]
MSHIKEILTAVGTLGCAIGIGFIMQSSDTAEKRYGNGDGQIERTEPGEAALKGADAGNTLLDVQEITLTSAEFDTSLDVPVPSVDSQVTTVSAPTSILPEPDLPGPAVATPACEIVASARAVAAAMVNLSMTASCLPGERVTVHHNGMIFTETTSDTGNLDITVPALAQDAVFIVAFSNGDGAVAQTKVEELVDFDRVVLQWKGQTGFEIHAREFGADYGARGHVWAGDPGDIAAAVTGNSGLIMQMGDTNVPDALFAEVYSFPKAATSQNGDIALSVEAEVNKANCGLEIEAQSLEVGADGQVKTQNLTLSVPECDAIGNFLVLNNLLQDLKVARN